MAQIKKRRYQNTGLDRIFWIALILYSNPGGLQEALNINEIGFQINFNDILFVILSLCYFVIPKKAYLNDRDFRRIRYAMVIFLIYCFVIYGYITPTIKQVKSFSFIFAIIKLRYALYSVQICLYTYVFFQRSATIFLKYLLISSVLTLLIFLQTLITGIELLPNFVMSRGFIDINRNLMISYGLMPILIPLGISFFVNKVQTRFNYFIIIGFCLMFTAWLVSVTRRQILGSIVYLLIALVLNNYLLKGSLKNIFRITLRVLVILLLLLMTLRITFPTYLKAGETALLETIYVLKYGESSTGQVDERLKFSKPFIVEQFLESPYLGTGFDNRWKTDIGDEEGFEASDYPFLAALAMFGLVGVLIFLPIYFFIIKFLYRDIKFLRKFKIRGNETNYLLLFTFIIFFIFDLIKYFEYFRPASLYSQYNWYCYVGLYLASRKMFYSSI